MERFDEAIEGLDLASFQSLRLSVVATDLKGTVLLWSDGAERLFKWQRAEALGRHVLEVTAQDDSYEQGAAIIQQLLRGRIWAGEFRVADKQGHPFTINVIDIPVRDASGEVIAILGVAERLADTPAVTGHLAFADDEMRRLRRLTARQVQILRLMGLGLTNEEIADSLSLSPNTVKVHITRIIERLHTGSRTKAALFGSRLSE